MAHALQAIVLAPSCAIPPPQPAELVLVALPQDFSLIPVTDELFDEVDRLYDSGEGDPHTAFWRFSASLRLFVLALSRTGPVAYIETEYFGGVGEQAAAAWDLEALVAEPKRDIAGPVNAALSAIGVVAGPARDEFESLSLGALRDLDVAVQAGHRIGELPV